MNSLTDFAGEEFGTIRRLGMTVTSDRRKVISCIVTRRIEPRIYRKTRTIQQDRVAIWRGLRDGLRPDAAAGAPLVFNDDLLAPDFGQPVRQRAGNRVAAPAGWKRHHKAHVSAWIGLRPCNVRDRRQRGSAHGQLQKLPAQNLHYKLLNSYSITSSAVASN